MQAAPGVDRPVPDAPAGNWVDRRAPVFTRPYLRLARIDRPIGWWLLLLPCWWSTAAAAIAAGQGFPSLAHLALFLVGAVAMRGAGSTYNDIVDRELDAKVARTRNRPLPSGQLTVAQAAAFLVLQALVGLAVLVQFNGFAVGLGLGSLAVVAVYPFMKRITSMPQLVLGFAFAWGGLMGWAATFGRLDAPAFLIYAAAIAWTVGYDTIYALQDIDDDPIAGIKSSARLFGERAALGVGLCYAAALASLAGALALIGVGPVAWAGFLAFALHLAWQVKSIDRRDGAKALRLFKSNRDAGLLLFAGLALDAVIARAL
ncbi:4-hydroxybenzoate octaprenyltransferase [Chelatococcus sp. SYSU_G07232]|uniref:4-hydroxybenzoate octaprenyltransferase n=1 Tax=Chelatococcus albus TaxID=3047466 RepID=A0ABT7AKW2_9HYPH|nr:4-hydroxybenzoate octaprenyltransferase [Chelatococcus sp. SYSU_G07232]MDJ1160020.1 4-hydroxybenzoate octaprenyltransferase [Chelatococcus sp. SYSU_G07232]